MREPQRAGGFQAGRCDVLTSDTSQLAALRIQLDDPASAMILPDVISKEPLSPVVRQKDDDWLLIVKWTLFAMINAEELGIDRASLYYYISSKEELFDEILREVIEKNFAIASRIQASTAKPKEKLREVIKALMQSYGDNYPLLYIYVRENLSQVSDRRTAWSNQMRKLNRQTEDAIIAIVEEGFADGSLRRVGTAKIVTYGILGVLGWTNRWFKPERSELSAAEIGEVLDPFARGHQVARR